MDTKHSQSLALRKEKKTMSILFKDTRNNILKCISNVMDYMSYKAGVCTLHCHQSWHMTYSFYISFRLQGLSASCLSKIGYKDIVLTLKYPVLLSNEIISSDTLSCMFDDAAISRLLPCVCLQFIIRQVDRHVLWWELTITTGLYLHKRRENRVKCALLAVDGITEVYKHC